MKSLGPRPDPLPWGERILNFWFRAPLFFLSTAFFGSLALAASVFEKSGRVQHRIAQAWARASLTIAGVRVRVIHPERLERVAGKDAGAAVYACNHLSYMDTPAIFAAIPFQFRIVARHDLWKLPFIGWYLERSGQVAVNLEDPRASISSLLGAVRTLESGMPLFIFPEGGRSETGRPQAFMKGPAFMAIRAQVPVVPMALIGTWELLPMHSSEFHPVPVTVVVGEPIATRGMTKKQVDELTKRLEQEVVQMYYEHSWLAPPSVEDGAPSAQFAESRDMEAVTISHDPNLAQEEGKR